MSEPAPGVTGLLLRWGEGDESALNELMPLVYQEMKVIARRHLVNERPDHTLQPTALVNEAYMRLVDQTRVAWQNRAQFLAVASTMMRRILVSHARKHLAGKRGAGATKITFVDGYGPVEPRKITALNQALERLSAMDDRQGKIVEMRYFGGLTIEETAHALDLSPTTVKREWATARLWLRRELN